ncbi:ATP-dependent zinc metalloprotease FtsH [Mucilaginibacter sp. KACC 22773]|uniref:ATP-dependent zinc metalloprotease FtsH n=1 Tax=Mucilaginibacter sp. KACC 22773 TaxID=3025671 RepID=UPI0023650295|nr:ATP-dependent zinc metalloprotease FtsH [Mucilaginibacter sp. KACC 22773]WDF79898.1 ATP-dependent zinc metalloprotease FtsH [Mucilaginibacter sp. KACC 22773]
MKNNQQVKPGRPVKRKTRPAFSWVWVYVIIFLYVILSPLWSGSYNVKETTWQQFSTTILNRKAVERLEVVNKEKVNVYLKSAFAKDPAFKEVFTTAFGKGISTGPHYTFTIGSVESFEHNMEDAEKNFAANEKIPVSYSYQSNWLLNILSWLVPFILLLVIWNFLMRRAGGGMAGTGGSSIFNFGKSTATLIEKENSTVTFADVAGLDEAKVEVLEIVDFLKKPASFTKLGAKIPKGVILVGPPGTGKTLLAKAVAGEAQVPFFSISGAAFVEMFVGVGASRVRDLFQQAKEKAPCIIFIDEIDAIGRSRGKGAFLGGANDERESTLNQLLTEMDGFGTNTGVIVLAATNRADMLDPALIRPGRFDRHIYLELPNMNERAAIFKVHMAGLTLATGIDRSTLAGQTPGFSGADIANICNEAALVAARRKAVQVEKADFMDAIDRIVAGLEKKSKIISPEEKRTTSFHEAGHAVISWLLKTVDPLVKVSIIPRGKSLGAAWYLPEEKQLRSKTAFREHLCATLGGRAAEEIVFGEVSSGALDDLEKVTKEAYAMVVYYGFNEKLGNVSYFDSTDQRDLAIQKPFSEATGELIDQEIRKLVAQAYLDAKTILAENKASLEQVANLLLKKEVIYKDDLENILGKRGTAFPAIDLKVETLL